MFSNAYKPIINGVVRSISLYRQGLIKDGHFVSIFAPDDRSHDDVEPFVFRYPSVPLRFDYAFPVTLAPHISWLLPRLKLNILHAHHPFALGKEASRFSQSLGIPLVFTFHTLYHEYAHYMGVETDIVKQLLKRVVRDFIEDVDCIIAPSPRVSELFPSYGIDRAVEVLPTPVDLTLFPPRARPPLSNQDRFQVIYVGRAAKEKNLPFLLRAFAWAVAAEPRFHLRIVGGGPEREHLMEEAKQMGLARQVEFVGAIPFDRVPDELSRADMFVFASTTETQGLVVLEAMAAGLPMVLADSPALLDCARPGVDCQISRLDEVKFAEAMLRLAHDPGRGQEMGRSARAQAEHYSVDSLTQRLLAIYQNTMDAYHRGVRV
ncbi:MAG: glycosyltransferase [Caldilineales bacterium]|nr:glycosyltransferase [Caldilineales bacterium]